MYVNTNIFLDDVKKALEWTRELLKIDPEHVRAVGNIPHYEKAVAQREEKLWKKRRGVCI